MRPPLIDRDPGDETDTLFDPSSTLPLTCKSCGATTPTMCRWAADRDYGGLAGKRPRTCLHSSQLSRTDPLPY